jgi:hypothetical protein
MARACKAKKCKASQNTGEETSPSEFFQMCVPIYFLQKLHVLNSPSYVFSVLQAGIRFDVQVATELHAHKVDFSFETCVHRRVHQVVEMAGVRDSTIHKGTQHLRQPGIIMAAKQSMQAKQAITKCRGGSL